jgi:hypothetical protein
MPNKQLKKFCKLDTYIEQKDMDFYKVFNQVCSGHILRPVRGSDGVTFLYPKEKSYRQKIINSVYGDNPENAVKMIKALVIRGYYPNTKSFTGEISNTLQQKIPIGEVTDKHVKIGKDLVIEKDPNFSTFGSHNNMAVYILSGKGEMPLDGPKASELLEKPRVGGGNSSSEKDKLHSILQSIYSGQIEQENNIYVKKVFLQLKYLCDIADVEKSTLLDYLGNDEISDSYLLDMYCEKFCTNFFSTVCKCMDVNSSYFDKLNNITKQHYIDAKKCVLGDSSNNNSKDPDRMKNLQSPMDIRDRVNTLYNSDNDRIAKDLFIVFCNINKDLWMTSYNKVESYENFAYMASKIYTCKLDIINTGFDIPRDLTLYGNLLKSDVFLYSPQAEFSNVTLPVPETLPSPMNMSLYSLCGFVNSKLFRGGSNEPELDKLLECLNL